MSVLPVATTRACQAPPVHFKHANQLGYVHRFLACEASWLLRGLDASRHGLNALLQCLGFRAQLSGVGSCVRLGESPGAVTR
jgi:hypothetical protein